MLEIQHPVLFLCEILYIKVPNHSRVLTPILDVARMTFDDFLSQTVIFDVAVNFGCGDVFVSQHGLDDP